MAADNNRTPRHGRHTAASRHVAQTADSPSAQSAEVTPTVQDAVIPAVPAGSPSETGSLLTEIDQELQMGDAPQPVGVDPSVTGSFSRITADEGAKVTTRANASETASFRAQSARPVEAVRMSTAGRPKVEHRETTVETNGRVFVIIAACVLVVLAIIGWLVMRALVSVESSPVEQVQEQVQADASESIEYRGVTYALQKTETGAFALTSTAEGQETAATLCELKGTPVALILYETAFIIPENLPDGTWDLIAYHLGGGSMTQQVVDAEGKAIVQQGEIASAVLQGDSIEIDTASGEHVSVSLT